jgi:ArsR family transcriptional regulator, arsenate/arsenite/antimonite-responsive transcriptional repressor
METKSALAALAALSHETRLAAYRLLIEAGPQGLAVGDIADRQGLAAATLSFHLAHLRRAGLVRSRREGRTLFQCADYGAMNELIGYLTENCCGASAEACATPGCDPSPIPGKDKSDESVARARLRMRSR